MHIIPYKVYFTLPEAILDPKYYYSFRGVLVLKGVPCTLMCSSSKGKRDMVVSKRKQIRSFETLYFLYIKNMFSFFSFNFHIKQQ